MTRMTASTSAQGFTDDLSVVDAGRNVVDIEEHVLVAVLTGESIPEPASK